MYNVWWSGIELGLQKQIVRVYWNGKLIFFFFGQYTVFGMFLGHSLKDSCLTEHRGE